jgi:hypothetical protein
MLTSHMHKRGVVFSVDLVKNGVRTHLFDSEDYADPDQLVFDGQHGRPKPIYMRVGDRIDYACRHANGTNGRSQRLGCQESDAETPGRSIIDSIFSGKGIYGAAKDCTTDTDCCPAGGPCADAAYPNRTFSGRCVPANVVFGFTSNDEMCILPGAYYDPDPNATDDDAACDIQRFAKLPK